MTLKPDEFQVSSLDYLRHLTSLPAPLVRWTPKYVVFKFICDKGSALIAVPIVCMIAACLLVLNPLFNPGPLFFRQDRMGMGGRRFTMWKFRTMSESEIETRAHDAPLEEDRISTFAKYLRTFRIDELPNFFNVFFGHMSLVGPRPDAWDHSRQYASDVSFYPDRFRVRPGITGLAQISVGYADCPDAIRRKARYDRFFVKKSRIRLELYILRKTVMVILTGHGAR
jgi:lipopolysaccharide/colanic/teichoic acid biosynthesis glycosyltransferase